MYKFSFVVLHYLNSEDTIGCVESIKENINYLNYNIIIVDNGSFNNSGIELLNKYSKDKHIHVILNKENLGFANGNNIGYKYAKYELKSDFICLINNDTTIKQNNFVEECLRLYEESNYFVLGPDIISTVDGGHQNPHRMNVLTQKDVKRNILKLNTLLVLDTLFIIPIYKKLQQFYINCISKDCNTSFKDEDKIYINELENVELHGSCLIFSPNYVTKFEGLYDKTFMYVEEDILFYICKINNFKTVYSPSIQIFHKESSSTNILLSGSKRKKRRFFYENMIKSFKEFLNLMKSEEKFIL